MPYEGEFAGYRSLRRIVETERVQHLLKRSRVYRPEAACGRLAPRSAPVPGHPLPDFVVAIDGSNAEVPVANGYPGAHVGYCTVASVLLNLKDLDRLDEERPVDPREFRRTEESATIDAALPGSNVVTSPHSSSKAAFREALFEVLHDVVVDEEDRASLLDTYEALLAQKPQTREQACPYDDEGCQRHLQVAAGITSCVCDRRRPIYSTDALRIHERFRDVGSNGEAIGEVMQVWERVLLVHLLRCFERREWLDRIGKLAFMLDGPLAVFGHPAWLSAAINRELMRLNRTVQQKTGLDLCILGIEKTGTFVAHFEDIDKTETGEAWFPGGSYLLLTDRYIKERVIFSNSEKRYGLDPAFSI